MTGLVGIGEQLLHADEIYDGLLLVDHDLAPDVFRLTVHDVDSRRPTGWVNYDRNVVAAIAEHMVHGVPMGPTTIGEPLFPVAVEYDGVRTRVGFSFMPPSGVAA